MGMVIQDIALAKRFLRRLKREQPDRTYEVWDGDVVVAPLAND